jgi:hypothetical protein
MAQDREIKYVNKNFTDFRSQLIEYAKNYFPNTYNDFTPTSPGMMFIEMAAYVGDVLSFYQDMQLQETYLQYAKDPANLYNLAYMMGYRPKISSVATVTLDMYQEVRAKLNANNEYEPDLSYAATVESNAVVQSNTSPRVNFLTQDKVNFAFSSSFDPTEVTVFTTVGSAITYFLLKKQVKAISAEIREIDYQIPAFERFKTITLADTNILGILDITGSNGEVWTEVPYLAQDTVFTETANTGSTESAGGGNAHNNLQPYITLNYIIKT